MTRIRRGSAISARAAISHRRKRSVALDQWIGVSAGLGRDHTRGLIGMFRVRATCHSAHSSKFFARAQATWRHTVVAHNEFAPMNVRGKRNTCRRYAPAGKCRNTWSRSECA